MNKNVFILIALVVMGSFYSCVKDLHDSGISDATLMKGRVLEESGREPVENVKVTVTNGSTEYASTKTNNEGRFEITVNYNNFDVGNYLFLDAGSSGITKILDLKGMGQEIYNYGDIFLYNKNDGATPTISTSAVRDITSNVAVCGGNITSDGGSEVVQRGLCWNTTENPQVSDYKVLCGNGTGEYTGTMTGLSSNTRYYVRAYATNAIGTSYGEQREFTTANGSGTTQPTVSTNPISNITLNSAECGGNVTSDGGATVTERGICWAQANVTNRPTLSNNSVRANVGGTGSFTCTMSGLSSNTSYFVRAYAKNSVGISYGDSISFTTLSGGGRTTPTVNTGNSSNVTSSSATCRGDLVSDGGANMVSGGICYSTTSQNPTWNSSSCVYASNLGSGTFYCNLTNLQSNTTYYYRAYAINTVGESYGVTRTFRTLANTLSVPDVYTYTAVYNPNNNTVTCTGFIISEGDAPITVCGFRIGTSPSDNNPNISYSSGPNSSGIFTSTISNMSPGTYSVTAFATNAYGTGSGFAVQLVIPNQ